MFEKENIKFEPFFEVSTSDMIAEMVDKDIGIGFLFDKTIERYSNLRKIEITSKLPVFDIYIIYKDYLLSVSTKAFIKYVVKK